MILTRQLLKMNKHGLYLSSILHITTLVLTKWSVNLPCKLSKKKPQCNSNLKNSSISPCFFLEHITCSFWIMIHIQEHPYCTQCKCQWAVEVKFESQMCWCYIIASNTMAHCSGNSTKPSWAMRILSDGVYTSSPVTQNLLWSKTSWDGRRRKTLPSKTCTMSPLGYITS